MTWEGTPSAILVFQCGTAAMECVRQYINEVLDFMADMHTLTKLKVRGLPKLVSEQDTEMFRELSSPDGIYYSLGQQLGCCLTSLDPWESGALSFQPVQRGKRKKGCLHGRSYVHSFNSTIYLVLMMPQFYRFRN